MLAGYSLDHDRRHGVRRHDGWMPVIITEASPPSVSEAQQVEVCRLAAAAGRRPPRVWRLHGLRRRGRPPPRGARRGTRPPRRRRHPPASRARNARDAGAVPGRLSIGRCLPRTGPDPPPQEDLDRAGQRPVAGGDAWRVTYRGRSSAVRHVKGMLDLAVLLDRPGREVPALELMGGAAVGGAPGPVLDDQARRTYQGRVARPASGHRRRKAANDWERGPTARRARAGRLVAATQPSLRARRTATGRWWSRRAGPGRRDAPHPRRHPSHRRRRPRTRPAPPQRRQDRHLVLLPTRHRHRVDRATRLTEVIAAASRRRSPQVIWPWKCRAGAAREVQDSVTSPRGCCRRGARG